MKIIKPFPHTGNKPFILSSLAYRLAFPIARLIPYPIVNIELIRIGSRIFRGIKINGRLLIVENKGVTL